MRYLRFTIRDLLALTFVAALGAMAFASMRQQTIAQQGLLKLKSELESNQVVLGLLQAQTSGVESEIDWLEAKVDTLQSAADHIPWLQEKYGTLEQGDPGTFAIRSVPMIVDDDYRASSWRMRVLVPDAEELFLKCGVAKTENLWWDPEQIAWQTESPLDQSGPFEIRLGPGIHEVDVATSRAGQNEKQRFRIAIDNIPVLITTSRNSDVSSSSYTGPSAKEPIYVPLGTAYPLGQWEFGIGQGQHGESMLRLWLDDSMSGFAPFPSQQVQPEGSP